MLSPGSVFYALFGRRGRQSLKNATKKRGGIDTCCGGQSNSAPTGVAWLWLPATGPRDVRVPDVPFTCKDLGRIIDFAVVSVSLMPFLSTSQVVAGTPWPPHFGLSIYLNRSLRSISTWKHIVLAGVKFANSG